MCPVPKMILLRVVLFCYSMGFLACMAAVTFTNLKCTVFNESYGEFKECRIRAVNRTHKYVNIYVKLSKPVDNITINLKILRYDHGYKPFFVDVTIDACKFLRNQNKNLFANLVYETFRNSSNLNHTCPYDHDVIVDKFWTGNLDESFKKYLPILNGDYMIGTTFYVFKQKAVTVDIYVKKIK